MRQDENCMGITKRSKLGFEFTTPIVSNIHASPFSG